MNNSPYWFTPQTQSGEGEAAQFQLRPLTLRGLYDLRASFNDQGVPTSSGLEVALGFVTDWKNVEPPFSPQAKRALLDGAADSRWILWLAEIAGELFRGALVPETERKN